MAESSEALADLRRLVFNLQRRGRMSMSAGDAAALLSALDVAQVVARSLEIDRDQLRAAVGACQPIDSLSAAMRVLDPAPDERAPADPEADFVRQIEDVLYPDRAGAFLRRAQARGGA